MTEPGGRGSPRAARVSESGLGTEGDGWNDDFQFTARSPRGSDGGKVMSEHAGTGSAQVCQRLCEADGSFGYNYQEGTSGSGTGCRCYSQAQTDAMQQRPEVHTT